MKKYLDICVDVEFDNDGCTLFIKILIIKQINKLQYDIIDNR